MIALIKNSWDGDGNPIQQIIGIFNNELEIPEDYKRTEYREDEIYCNGTIIKRFLNLEESRKLEQDPEFIYEGGYLYTPFYSVKEIKIGEIFNWEL